MCVCVCVRKYVYVCVYTYVCTHLCGCGCGCWCWCYTCMCVYPCTCARVCVCVHQSVQKVSVMLKQCSDAPGVQTEMFDDSSSFSASPSLWLQLSHALSAALSAWEKSTSVWHFKGHLSLPLFEAREWRGGGGGGGGGSENNKKRREIKKSACLISTVNISPRSSGGGD